MSINWWKESVIYQIYPRSFKDSNGDGIGDLQGIISKLDYLQNLGVDILWLSPINKSPNDDNGYDISDYEDIMEEFGTMEDFDELLKGIHQRGMKMIMDLVINHSSDEHHWFQESRKSKDSPYRDYYFWKDEKPNNWKSFFGGDAWDYDALTDSWYLHYFSKKQPDLNWENPKLRQEIYKMMRFWLDKGIDGFRMDVIPFLSKRLEFEDADMSDFNLVMKNIYANGPRLHEFLQEMNKEVLSHYDIVTIGEAPGVDSNTAPLYVNEDRKELNMIYHFDQLFIDAGEGGRFDVKEWSLSDLKKTFIAWDKALEAKGWVNLCLENHDFARLVSRFGNDSEAYREISAKMLAVLLLTLRGTPCMYQGSEIGMTNVAFDNLEDYKDIECVNAAKEWKAAGKDMQQFLLAVHKVGRDNARTPIQWDDSPQAGFTTGTPWIKVNPNYTKINVAESLSNEESIFYFYQQLLHYRKANPSLIYGDFKIHQIEDEQIFRFSREDEYFRHEIILNCSDEIYDSVAIEDDYSLEICNYKSIPEAFLKPWEARIYKELV